MSLGQWLSYLSYLSLFMAVAIANDREYHPTYNMESTHVLQTIYVDPSSVGNYPNIQSAIDAVPSNNKNWISIHIPPGIYREQVNIPEDKPFICLQGGGEKNTIIIWDACESIATSATFSVFADNFVAKGITFVNSYNSRGNRLNPRKQALAARIEGDKCSFYRCAFMGIQDTLWDVQGRHYFYGSTIVGAVDFIFGAGQSIYESCNISVAGGVLNSLAGYITAQGRTNPNDPNGFVFKNCNVTGTGKVYLGRPWRDFARVLYFNCNLSDVIVPQGWNPWSCYRREYQLTFAEHGCTGPGSYTGKRVKWEKQLSDQELQQMTSISFIDNEGWISRQP